MTRLRLIIFTGLLLASAAADGVRADEAEKKAVNDTITATKRDLEALKTDHILPVDQKLSLPGMEAPSMSMPSSLPASPLRQNEPGPAPTKSATWLLDAMEKDSPRSPDERSRDTTGKFGTDSKSQAGPFGDAKETARSADGTDRREPARGETERLSNVKDAPNPLTSYMTGWMTPRDFNLLLKPEETGAATLPGSSLDTPGQSLFLPGSTNFAAALPGGAVSDLAVRNGPAGPGPAENPYLQAIALPSPQGGPLPAELNAPPVQLAAPRPAPLSLPPVSEPDKPAPYRPEMLKRDDDAKYFPQLKRF
jgi:hypothetical protein